MSFKCISVLVACLALTGCGQTTSAVPTSVACIPRPSDQQILMALDRSMGGTGRLLGVQVKCNSALAFYQNSRGEMYPRNLFGADNGHWFVMWGPGDNGLSVAEVN